MSTDFVEAKNNILEANNKVTSEESDLAGVNNDNGSQIQHLEYVEVKDIPLNSLILSIQQPAK